MPIEDRRQRERTARRQLIIATARALAEREGWDAVTTRRLSVAIEYSQPVIYTHFASMDDLVQAVALEGFSELAEVLSRAQHHSAAAADVIGMTARAYLAFATENPAVYNAMFTQATKLTFGPDKAPPPLRTAFQALSGAVARAAGERDLDTLTEVLWAVLHGLTTLTQSGRLRPDHIDERIRLVVAQFCGSPSQQRVPQL